MQTTATRGRAPRTPATTEAHPDARFGTVTADRFVLPWPDGKPAIEMGWDHGAPTLLFWGRDGEIRMECCLDEKDVPSVNLLHDGNTQARFELDDDGHPSLVVGDGHHAHVAMEVGKHGSPALKLVGRDGKGRLLCGLDETDDDGPCVDFVRGGNSHMSLTLCGDGRPSIALCDVACGVVASVTVTSDGRPELLLGRRDGAHVLAHVNAEDDPEIIAARPNGAVCLYVEEESPGVFLQKPGAGAASLAADSDGPLLTLMDAKSESRLEAKVGKDGLPSLLLGEEDGLHVRAHLRNLDRGGAAIEVGVSENDEIRLATDRLNSAEGPFLSQMLSFMHGGNDAVTVAALDNGSWLDMNGTGKAGLHLHINDAGLPEVALCDAEGTVQAGLKIDPPPAKPKPITSERARRVGAR